MSSQEDFMLPCLTKQMFGIDCLGCGMQRSALLLVKGEFSAAFQMYPAIFTLVLLLLFFVLHLFYKFKYGHIIILGLFILNIIIIVTNYILNNF